MYTFIYSRNIANNALVPNVFFLLFFFSFLQKVVGSSSILKKKKGYHHPARYLPKSNIVFRGVDLYVNIVYP